MSISKEMAVNCTMVWSFNFLKEIEVTQKHQEDKGLTKVDLAVKSYLLKIYT